MLHLALMRDSTVSTKHLEGLREITAANARDPHPDRAGIAGMKQFAGRASVRKNSNLAPHALYLIRLYLWVSEWQWRLANRSWRRPFVAMNRLAFLVNCIAGWMSLVCEWRIGGAGSHG